LARTISYKDAGVDINEADRLVDYLKTKNKAIGGFSGLMALPKGYKKPLLVASTDGVGTKLLLAKAAKDYSTIGIDLVGMVVNDMAVCGARPLFFLDYYATSALKLKEARQVIDGILEGCSQAGCPLIGGETAELPGLYQPGDFDLAGFAVGVVDAEKAITGKTVKPGDVVFGISSSGVHSNGYSLVRKIVENSNLPLNKKVSGLGSRSLGKVLLEPTRIYTALVSKLIAKVNVKAFAHITGGGIVGNLNRVLPKNCDAIVHEGLWPVLPVFDFLEQQGPVAHDEMYRTFNMGLGMMGVVSAADVDKLIRAGKAAGEEIFVVGTIEKGTGIVEIVS
jgi:phosphoribosylformylglycinamidine cyclo-ligase